ncbi:hypothetical protein Tsubulata_019331 [Turnera subulata]|uniref:F-box domain-containing protein n=1 Tax=Turnera subulata TaxID=218843 RepID=A0A9Q0GDT8_9ROSI|nr:hypothetical protein Tsubulata_019331 [Turnera subulata]
MANLTLPSVIVEEILAMLPVKSIHRFRQVSKSWSSFLVSSEFQKLRTNNSTPPETDLEKILQCFAVNDGHVIESLACPDGGEEPVRLCFPTDKICACGFGYDSEADDYKVFIATKPALDGAMAKIFSFLKMRKKTKVEIFSLRTGSWKEVETTGGNSVEHIAEEHEVGLFSNGALHWEVWTGGKIKIIAFDLAKEKFYDISVLALPRDLVGGEEGGDHPVLRLRCRSLVVLGEYLCMSFFGGNSDVVLWMVYIMEEYCNGGSWVEFIAYHHDGCVGRITFRRDFVPQAVKDGGYVILHFPGGVQHILRCDNVEETDGYEGLINKEMIGNKEIKFWEYRETIIYTEALTSPYASPEIKQLQV